MTVSILASFDIAKAKDENGKEIEMNDFFTEGIVRFCFAASSLFLFLFSHNWIFIYLKQP